MAARPMPKTASETVAAITALSMHLSPEGRGVPRTVAIAPDLEEEVVRDEPQVQ